ncbi:metallo ase [Fusarium agapanthi]|uniref:Metallo ase n=1 Tax=Fusarium agapanthi TaxID=1803897 RepID=A0A9P5BKT9_9HYPO|nr:metallo ase [Fusarium agapanthi]
MSLASPSSFDLLFRDREVAFTNEPLPVLIDLTAWFTDVSYIFWPCGIWIGKADETSLAARVTVKTENSIILAPPSFANLNPDVVLAETENILTTTSGLHDDLAATFTPSTATSNDIIRPIVDGTNRAACRLRILTTLLGQLSPDKELRDAARQAETRVAAAQVKILMRHDIASLVGAIYEREKTAPDGNLDGQDRHLLTRMHGEYLRSGSFLRGEKEREELRAAMEEIDQVRSAAQTSFTEDEGGIWFDRADLGGVPETVLESMPQQGTRIQVTFQNAHVTAVMRHAVSNDTRRRFAIADQNRLPENVPRLASLVTLRSIVDKMAPSVDYVEAQLGDLHKRLKPLAVAETDRLIKLKQRDCKEPLSELYSWDRAYYLHKQARGSFFVGHVLLAEYFEANHTLQGMLDVFHELFCIDFKPIVTSVWQENVVAYEVWDAPSEGGRFLGHLYVDLFDREGKYRGAHHVLIQSGFIEAYSDKHYPASPLVCSFACPSLSRPTLLQHSEVKTMFHELGHAIHNILARTKYAIPHSRDFIEIPSIMLENGIWLPDVLIRLGSHYKSQEALPRELAETVARTRNANRANIILAQVQPALFDLAIHTPLTHKAALEMATTEVWNRTKRDILTHSFGPNPQDWEAGQARFAHMFRKNDGSYFAYPLSMVIAADLFGSKFAKDPLSPEIGRRYRYQVLEPGSSRPEIDILKDFLGREPSSKTILDELCHDS